MNATLLTTYPANPNTALYPITPTKGAKTATKKTHLNTQILQEIRNQSKHLTTISMKRKEQEPVLDNRRMKTGRRGRKA